MRDRCRDGDLHAAMACFAKIKAREARLTSARHLTGHLLAGRIADRALHLAVRTGLGLGAVVVAGLVAGDHAVTAALHRTIVATAIVIDTITIVAGFDAVIDNSITASRDHAVVAASIGLHFVAVITGFKTGFALGDITALNTIAAARRMAAGGAGVGHDLVAIIAGFAMIDSAVATDFAKTGI